MKIKTSELSGVALDWAVAKCEGVYTATIDTDIDGTVRFNYGGMYPEWSTDWAQGGEIIERERIDLFFDGFDADDEALPIWGACHYNTAAKEFGSSPLIAAMRCYVASKLGDEVEAPDEMA